MQYKILGNTMPAVEILFDQPGESMYTQSGGMAWMSDGVEMDTNTRGGLLKGVGRMFAGESLFMANYTAQAPGATIAFASTVGAVNLVPNNKEAQANRPPKKDTNLDLVFLSRIIDSLLFIAVTAVKLIQNKNEYNE